MTFDNPAQRGPRPPHPLQNRRPNPRLTTTPPTAQVGPGPSRLLPDVPPHVCPHPPDFPTQRSSLASPGSTSPDLPSPRPTPTSPCQPRPSQASPGLPDFPFHPWISPFLIDNPARRTPARCDFPWPARTALPPSKRQATT